MGSPIRLAGHAAAVLALTAGVATAGAPPAAVPLAPGGWHTLVLPAPAAALCQAVDLPEPAALENLFFDLIRVLHERPLPPADFRRGRASAVLRLLRSAPAQPSKGETAPAGVVPLPLAPATWARTILKRPVAPPALLEAILANRRAALLYMGLCLVDAETLDTLERSPEILERMDERRAAALAAFGGSLAIRGGVVRVPGSDDLRGAWESLVGAPASDPARFVHVLLGRDRGRLAYFFDALRRLDAAHLRLAVGTASDPAQRLSRLTSLYGVFLRAGPEWDPSRYPFYRPLVDPATVLRTLRADPAGRLSPPSSRRIWERAFRDPVHDLPGSAAASRDQDEVDVPWLLDAVLSDGARAAPARVAQVRFAQRVFGAVPPTGDARLAAAVAGYRRFPALTLALERLGVTEPETYERAARVAAAVTERGSAVLALLQGCLALLDRAAWVRSLEQPEAERLAGSLFALNPESADYDSRLAQWVSAVLLPALAQSTGTAVTKDPEVAVLRALAGGSSARVERLRERQGPPRLGQALALYEAVEAIETPEAPPGAIANVSRMLAELDVAMADVDQNRDLRGAIVRARTSLSKSLSAGGETRLTHDGKRDLSRAPLAVLADVLVALTYLPSLGDPEGPVRFGGHVARRHLFTVQTDKDPEAEGSAWREPAEFVTRERGWHVEGSILGLDEALARLTLRRLDVDVIPAGPRLDENTRRWFVIDAARARPFDMTDAERDLVASGLRAGRARLASLGDGVEAVGSLVAAIPLEPRRTQALRWILARGAADLTSRLSAGEILRLGAAQPLPFDAATVPSAVCPRGSPRCRLELTDLTLRLIERLAERQLPVALLPGVLAAATQDFVDEVQPLHADDLQALRAYVADLKGERIDDYIAAAEDRRSSDLR